MLFTTTGTDLVYNIVEETLSGSLDGTSILAHAGSGGRAGTKTKNAVNIFLANNPYATGVKKGGQRPGGPLPMARYRLKTHESKNNWIRLLPFSEDAERLGNRDGFAIHGRGKWGSDGCIVPTDFHIVQQLYDMTKKREDDGKAAPTLAVVAVGDLDRFDRLRTLA